MWLTDPVHSPSLREVRQELKCHLEANTMEEHCLLAWLQPWAYSAFLHNPGPPTCSWCLPVCEALLHQLTNKTVPTDCPQANLTLGFPEMALGCFKLRRQTRTLSYIQESMPHLDSLLYPSTNILTSVSFKLDMKEQISQSFIATPHVRVSSWLHIKSFNNTYTIVLFISICQFQMSQHLFQSCISNQCLDFLMLILIVFYWYLNFIFPIHQLF